MSQLLETHPQGLSAHDARPHTPQAGFNHTAVRDPLGALRVHELFEAQVARTPEAAALEFDGGRLTYDELNREANRLAHRLRAFGVGPDVLVAIALERSPEMVVALLGVLKAGGAYVPLDPTYPRERLAYMLEDAAPKVLITRGVLSSKLPPYAAGRVLLLDEEAAALALEPDENPAASAEGDSLAYVIYTSGSTGRPKGTMIGHAGFTNYILWVNRGLAGGEMPTLPLITSLSFDASLKQLFAPLLRGDAVWMPREETVRQPERMLAELAARPGVGLNCVPTLWAAMLDALETGAASLPEGSLAHLFVGAERLSPELAARTFAAVPGIQLWNIYGPTEITANATFTRVRRGEEITIGRPIDNARAYVLDAGQRPVAVGVAGELYIGGAGVARGYLNRPALTAERFVPDPYSAEPGARMYRTGDAARFLADGRVEFIGRLDHQVKLRGFRIELGEIEAALRAHESVNEAVAVVREEGGAGARLVAYVTSARGRAAAPGELQAFLRERLPEYMVPSAFVVLGAMPLNPNGKIDRKALPAPPRTRPELRAKYAAPATPAEEALASIWSALLKVEPVGVDDNFFELGGHSLLAMQVISRARAAFKVELAPRAIFEHPTVRALAAAVERAGSEEEASADSEPVAGEHDDGELPLSFAQQRLWFLSQLEAAGPAYNIPAALRLTGRLDTKALGRALDEVVRRHDILRTSFAAVGGRPVQIVAEPAPLALPLIDLGTSAGREAEAREVLEREARRPFDLSQGPLLRALLVRLSEEEHVLSLTMHHIVSDGWSNRILLRELETLYGAYARGEESPLAPLPIQYGDFAVWQRKWLAGEVLERQLFYWTKQLEGAPPMLELPADRPRPPVRSFRGDSRPLDIDPRLYARLKALCAEQGLTPFMVLLGVLQLLLSRHSGQSDISVGTPAAGRTRLETEPLIGFFVNTLVLRTDLSGDPTAAELLGRVKEVTLEAQAHQDVPFERLVEELQPERSLSYTPLFQVMFAMQNGHGGEMRLPGLKVDRALVSAGTSKFDLTLDITEAADGLAGQLDFNTDIFDGATVERMAGHYVRLLEGVVGEPGRRLSELDWLTEAERRTLLEDFNATPAAAHADALVHELFERQAAATPGADALIYGERRLTYAELDESANRLARHLRALGVGPESLVGVCMERTPELLISLLAVFKAGGAYVPLDPAYPKDRVAFMLEDSRAGVLLTQRGLLGELPEHSAHVVCVDDGLPDAHAGAVVSGVRPDNLAYVIYTSGSTGRPKGVAITHSSACVLAGWARRTFEPAHLARVLASTSVCFDLSVFELFATLAAGGAVVMAPDALALAGMDDAGVTLLNTVPSAARELVRSNSVPRSVRCVCLAGEELPAELAAGLYALGHVEQVWNLYGPSEDTTYSTMELVPRDGKKPLIGRGVDATRLYVLDRSGRPVAVGVAGELYIGGDGLARGYLGRPALTAERFVPDPFASEPGSRLYRTGDSVRWLADGRVEYLGRLDHQVKVRGYRIELGEIEAALRARAGVSEAVVVVREDVPGDKRLVAYVVGADVPTAELRARLRERLPEYMVPSAFVMLEEMPLTPNGKVNKKALPAPGLAAGPAEEYVAPRTEVEEVLAGLWQDVLRVERVGAHDNFFELGGHSLLATQVVSRVREVFQTEVHLRSLFEAPTVAGLAELLTRLERAPGQVLATARIRKRLQGMSPEEIAALLRNKKKARG